MIVDPEPLQPLGPLGSSPNAVIGGTGSPGGFSALALTPAPPPPPPLPPPKPPQSQPIRVGGDIQNALAINRPNPVYPPLARQARIQGTVLLEALISKGGTIENLKIISGHPLLAPAAVEAVRHWRYRPTLLNGEPVEVQTTIEVHFSLGSP
jgi:protein TonB